MLFFMVLALASNQIQCPIYGCSTTISDHNTCATWNFDGIHFNKCSKGKTCLIPSGFEEKSYCVDTESLPSLLPGSNCQNSHQCLYNGECVKSVCQGKNSGQNCKTNKECDVDMYCKSGICTHVTNSCNQGEPCASDRRCYKGNCIIIGQLDNGQPSDNPELCKSYYIVDGKCQIGPKLIGNGICPKDSNCIYNLNGVKITQSCLCSKSANGKKYCPLGIGDHDLSAVRINVYVVYLLYSFV